MFGVSSIKPQDYTGLTMQHTLLSQTGRCSFDNAEDALGRIFPTVPVCRPHL
jgi:hypothetical protein